MEILYVVKLSRGANYDFTKSIYEQDLVEHGMYLKKIFEEGYLLMSGPFLDNSGAEIILKARDENHAPVIIDNDPAVLRKIFIYEIKVCHIRFNALKI